MEYSDFLRLSLPSRDNDTDIADINVLSNNFVTLDTFCGKTIPNMLESIGEEVTNNLSSLEEEIKKEISDTEKKLDERLSAIEGDYAQALELLGGEV